MTERHGYSIQGGWAQGSINGLPANVSYDRRSGNQPSEYKATQEIDFVPGFISGEGDEFQAYITSDNSSGGRSGNAGTEGIYRYGFNGKENDNDIEGEGNEQDYGMRIYDPRLGRFLSVDPLTSEYPWNSTYAFAENDVIRSIDVEGAEKHVQTFAYAVSNGETVSKVISNDYKQPKGTSNVYAMLGGTPTTTEEDVAQGFVSANHLPAGGTFSFFVFDPVLKKANYARYDYVDPGGVQQSRYFDAAYIDFMYDFFKKQQQKADKILNITAAVLNAAGSGALLKAELKGAAGELKALSGEAKASTSIDVTKGKFAQPNHSNNFSPAGQKILGVQTIGEGVAKLKSGEWSAAKLPIDYVVRDGQVYYLNTRSIATLTEAGIPKSQWVFENRTGVKTFEDNLTNNLNGSSGYTEVTNRQTGKKTKL